MKRLTLNIVCGPSLAIPPTEGELKFVPMDWLKNHQKSIRLGFMYPFQKRPPLDPTIEFINLKSFKKSNNRLIRLFQEIIYGCFEFNFERSKTENREF